MNLGTEADLIKRCNAITDDVRLMATMLRAGNVHTAKEIAFGLVKLICEMYWKLDRGTR